MTDRQPYVGVVPLGELDAIYGRDWERTELHELLLARGIVLMHSPSGAGKTSLIQAGLIPLLKKRGVHVLGPIRPGLPVGSEGVQGEQTRYGLSMVAQLDDHLDAGHRTPLEELAGVSIDTYLSRRAASTTNACLFLDQFEEVLTLDRTDVAAKREFFRQLGHALRSFDGLVLFSMREDHIGALEPYLRHIPTRLATRFRLDLLGEDAALEAIMEPARAAGVVFEEEAARHIWQSLCEEFVPQADGTVRRVPGPYVEAVQLQVVCKEVWQATRPDPARITADDVKALGRIDDALGRFYASAVASAASKGGMSERVIRDWFSERLIVQGLRAQVMEKTDAMEGISEAALRDLVDSHILHEEPRRGLRWFEVSHDRLIDPIVKSNLEWFVARPSRLREQAERYYAGGRSPELLLSLEELASAVPESRLERDFVEASRITRNAELRTNLAVTGWGLIVSADIEPAILEALEPLLARRRLEAGARYKQFGDSLGYRANETAEAFLARQGAIPGVADRTRVPYYLLIIGSPEIIPFEFQYGLAMHHAVGRLDFDTPDAYATYARSVVFCETGNFSLLRRLLVFAPQHEFDRATQISAQAVAQPMVERVRQTHPKWGSQGLVGDAATKQALLDALGGVNATPAVIVISHGMRYKRQEAKQRALDGAIVCQEWPGSGPANEQHYVAAEDVPDEARLVGTMACLVATSSAGTPTQDDFSPASARDTPVILAERPFVSALAKRLLSHPNGSALAVVGHVDRNWVYSLAQADRTSTGIFEALMSAIMHGSTIGFAMSTIAQRTAALCATVGASSLTGPPPEMTSLRRNFITATIDLRNYILLGDPATRLPISSEKAEVTPAPMLPAASAQEKTSTTVPAIEVAEDVVFAGVNGESGVLAMPPMTTSELVMVLTGGSLDRARQDRLRQWYARVMA